MPKLTDTQLVILSAAAQRDGGAVLLPPKCLKMNGGAFKSVLRGLLRKGLVTERPAPPDTPAWREDDDQRFMLTVAPAGLEALGIEPEPRNAAASAVAKPKSSRKPAHRKATKKPTGTSKQPGSKQDTIIHLLRRAKGATVPDLQKAPDGSRTACGPR